MGTVEAGGLIRRIVIVGGLLLAAPAVAVGAFAYWGVRRARKKREERRQALAAEQPPSEQPEQALEGEPAPWEAPPEDAQEQPIPQEEPVALPEEPGEASQEDAPADSPHFGSVLSEASELLDWPDTALAQAAEPPAAPLPGSVLKALEGVVFEPSPVKDYGHDVVRVQCRLAARADSTSVTVTDFDPWGLRYDLAGRAERGSGVILAAPEGMEGEPVVGTVAWCRKKPRREEYRVSLLYSGSVAELRRSWLARVAGALCPAAGHLGDRFRDLRVPVRLGDVPGSLLDLGLTAARVQLVSPAADGSVPCAPLVVGPWVDLEAVTLEGLVGERSGGHDFRFASQAGRSLPRQGQYLLRLLRLQGARG